MADTEEFNPEQWVDEHGDYLYRYAVVRLRDPSSAEDAVQEALLGAWMNRNSFRGDASVRTWLTGILKRKIADLMRKRAREDTLRVDEPQETSLEDLFDRLGHHKSPPQVWRGNPRADLERAEFWDCLHECIGRLPNRLARVFVMREMEDRNRDEICKVLALTPNNYWVMLHRARLKLRECLEQNWFLREQGKER